MRNMLIFFLFAIGMMVLGVQCEHWMYNGDDYAEGTHFDYTIRCEGGFIYKIRSREGAILILNSDGTPLRCGEKRH